MAKVAGPSKQVADALVEAVRAGIPTPVALTAQGITELTYEGWLSRGDPAGKLVRDKPFREFRARIEKARAEGQVAYITTIAEAADDGDWKAAAWLAERTSPEDWIKVNPARRGGRDGGSSKPEKEPEAKASLTSLPGDELAARRNAGED